MFRSLLQNILSKVKNKKFAIIFDDAKNSLEVIDKDFENIVVFEKDDNDYTELEKRYRKTKISILKPIEQYDILNKLSDTIPYTIGLIIISMREKENIFSYGLKMLQNHEPDILLQTSENLNYQDLNDAISFFDYFIYDKNLNIQKELKDNSIYYLTKRRL